MRAKTKTILELDNNFSKKIIKSVNSCLTIGTDDLDIVDLQSHINYLEMLLHEAFILGMNTK